MSRSNPTDNSPNPAVLRFEWDGANGNIRFFDRETKKNVAVPDGFTFILLDELATIQGWHEASESSIYANEVRDTRNEAFVVKAFKGPKLAEGFYSFIKDKVVASGGHFTANCYIGFRDDKKALAIGSLRFKGAALGAWMEFRKNNRKAIYEQAIKIQGFDKGKKGKVEFRTPKFHLLPVSEDTNRQAIALDVELQEYLKGYFVRTKSAAAVPNDADTQADAEAGTQQHEPDPYDAQPDAPPDETEPF